MGIVNSIRMKWQIFAYNFQWGDYPSLFSGLIPRVSIFIPLFGYIALFNDEIIAQVSFSQLTAGTGGFLDPSARMRFIYFGLVSLGLGSAIYYARRPYAIRLGENFLSYRKSILELASPGFFMDVHYLIRRSDKDPYTQGGKYYDSEYERFIELATGSKPGSEVREAYDKATEANWSQAVQQFEPLLTGMLEEKYFIEGHKRRFALAAAIFLVILGYGLVSIPSIELFGRVVIATFGIAENISLAVS